MKNKVQPLKHPVPSDYYRFKKEDKKPIKAYNVDDAAAANNYSNIEEDREFLVKIYQAVCEINEKLDSK